MYLESRVSKSYHDGLAEFLESARKNVVDTNNQWVTCPCIDCKNMKSYSDRRLNKIQAHLIKRGFMAGYECWTNHGEEPIEEQSEQCNAKTDDDAGMHDVEVTTICTSPGDDEDDKTEHASQGEESHGEMDDTS